MLISLLLMTSMSLTEDSAVVEAMLDEDRSLGERVTLVVDARPFPIEEVFWALKLDAVPSAWSPRLDRDLPLDPDDQAVLEAAIEQGPYSSIVGFLHSLTEEKLDVDSRLTILEILSWVGRLADLELALDAASPESEEILAPRSVKRGFGRTLASLHERHERMFEAELLWLFRKAHSNLKPQVVNLIQRRDVEQPVELLGSMLGEFSECDAMLLQAMLVEGREERRNVSERCLSAVRQFLTSEHPSWQRQACRVLGVLEDEASIPDLIARMGAADSNLRAAAQYGLEACARKKLGNDPVRWQAWYERDRAWWEEEADRAFDDLANAGVRRAMQALNEIGSHTLHRKSIADAVVSALDRPEPGVVLTTIQLLRRLGEDAIARDLVPLLNRSDEGIVRAAHEALRQLVGVNLPPNASAWDEHLRRIQW